MSHDPIDDVATDPLEEENSRLDARSVLIIFAAALCGALLFISSFDGALGLPGLL